MAGRDTQCGRRADRAGEERALRVSATRAPATGRERESETDPRPSHPSPPPLHARASGDITPGRCRWRGATRGAKTLHATADRTALHGHAGRTPERSVARSSPLRRRHVAAYPVSYQRDGEPLARARWRHRRFRLLICGLRVRFPPGSPPRRPCTRCRIPMDARPSSPARWRDDPARAARRAAPYGLLLASNGDGARGSHARTTSRRRGRPSTGRADSCTTASAARSPSTPRP